MNLWVKFDRFPPVAVRVWAKLNHGRPLENDDIAKRSGLSPAMVEALSQQTSWRGVDIPTARAFLAACGFDFTSRDDWHRVAVRLRQKTKMGRFLYLRRSPNYSTHFQPMLAKYLEFVRSQ